jgi:hypothetical protein
MHHVGAFPEPTDDELRTYGYRVPAQPRAKKGCGTNGGYQQHKIRGEQACEPCKEAARRYSRDRRARRRAAAAAEAAA